VRRVNPRIRSWLDGGHGVDAIVGRGDYFIPSPAYGDHDLILIMGQLLTWAEEGQMETAAETLQIAITALIVDGSYAEAARALISYLLIARERNEALPLDIEFVAETTRALRASKTNLDKSMITQLEALTSVT
jgi:hypothetical protein